MKKRILQSICMALCLLYLFSSCGKKVENIEFSKSSLELEPGQSYTLSLTITPNDAKANIKWRSDNPSVATVSDGVVFAINDGVTTITATDESGEKAICSITVKTLSAYSKLEKEEQAFFDAFVDRYLKNYYNPSSVYIEFAESEGMTYDYIQGEYQYCIKINTKVRAKNRLGGVSYEYTDILLKNNYFLFLDSNELDEASINAALQEYYKEQGWIG